MSAHCALLHIVSRTIRIFPCAAPIPIAHVTRARRKCVWLKFQLHTLHTRAEKYVLCYTMAHFFLYGHCVVSVVVWYHVRGPSDIIVNDIIGMSSLIQIFTLLAQEIKQAKDESCYVCIVHIHVYM